MQDDMTHNDVVQKRTSWSRWRSSRAFVVLVISVAMFTDNFLFSFIIPILPVILEDRMKASPSQTQALTSLILSMNALTSVIIGPVTGHLSDRTSFKNHLMVFAWIFNIIGTAITAWSTSLLGLFCGRFTQTISGSLIWIVGMAIIGDTVEANHLAEVLGFIALFVTGGLLCGPAVSGSLYKFASYAMTWASAFGVLLFGLILQILMVQPPRACLPGLRDFSNSEAEILTPNLERSNITDPLLSARPSGPSEPYHSILNAQGPRSSNNEHSQINEWSTKKIWWILLRKRRIIIALVADSIFAIVTASFETTIPIHVMTIFNWKTLQAGLLFLLVQAPTLILVVPAGLLKDKVGMRYPVSMGYLFLAPSLWLLGTPGTAGTEWANRGNEGRTIFILALLAIGVWRTLPLGFGAIEVLRGVDEIKNKHPGILGPHGGFSRAFTLSNVSWKLAMFIGPLISGGLIHTVGYYYLNVCLGMTISSMLCSEIADAEVDSVLYIIATLCAAMGIVTLIFLK